MMMMMMMMMMILLLLHLLLLFLVPLTPPPPLLLFFLLLLLLLLLFLLLLVLIPRLVQTLLSTLDLLPKLWVLVQHVSCCSATSPHALPPWSPIRSHSDYLWAAPTLCPWAWPYQKPLRFSAIPRP
jgi:hypothetical protein